ncbi:LRR receptor-like serine/threonine-protein kinase GSO1 [Durio zibethinus]|uniref:LRR receptor-like serine/threonine-protein kinase GSO1 n=1 Tax=Durio zibethinus TaxID=66656 RepID=A0A6P5Z155_DURZI|nr:LRR receptor-like serine/threonine-protein kinase GSO1 [Durio zibethinus]
MLSSVPTWIFSLCSLMSIDLSLNGAEGLIPNGFQNMSSLKFLDLSWNSFFSSSTLSWLSNLNQLQFLGLVDVGLKGNFLSAIGNLSSLTHLDVSRNGIDQEVSEIIESLSRCSMDRLESLNIASNKLSGHLPDQPGQFKILAYVSLAGNSISGPIPFSIGKLSSLKVLDVSHNRLNATLPQSLGQLGNLEHLDWLQFQKNLSLLDISHAEISGPLPLAISNLEFSFLSNNLFSGPLSNFLCNSSTKRETLTFLDIESNRLSATIISFCDGNSNVLCIESEMQALSRFKQHLIDRSNRLSSWVEGSPDIELDDERDVYFQSAERDAYFLSKLGGKINPSLIELKHLSCLDLSNNDFGGLAIPEFIGSRKSLTYLNLSSAKFSRAIPHNLGNLSKLHYLDLGHNSFFEAKTLQWVSGLSSLQYLDLSDANLTKATDWLQATNKLPSLVELHLSDCSLNNNDPSSISVNYTSLAVLDLSSNMLSSIPTWIFSLRSLVSIDLNSNAVEGVIPNGFQNMSSLKFLDLSWNSFSSLSTLSWLSNLNQLQFLGLVYISLKGNFSSAIGNLSSLTHLDVSRNGIDQEVSEIIESLSRCCLDRLESLNIASNKLSGHLPDQLGQFKNLAYLSLSGNSISGPIPLSIGKLSSLKFLYVAKNRLNATLPQSLGQLGNLEHLNVSNNMLEGNISEMFFSNLLGLTVFWASNNMLTFKPNPSWIPPFQWKSIGLGSLSNILCNFSTKLETLTILDIESNLLSGEIPDCWENYQTLEVLNLGNNNLNGKIPRSLGSVGGIESLNLRNNNLFGEVPSILQHLANLLILDLCENQLTGSIPAWIGDKLLSLVFLDLGYNNISEAIPKCFSNLSAMAAKPLNGILYRWVLEFHPNNWFYLGALLVMRGREDEYSTTLGLVTGIDLSGNSLTGKIPRELGNLKELRSLYLSGNLLTGQIPENIGNLEVLESLDLSMNRLQGEIPSSFSNLNFLNHFNVSYNNLTGKIPLGTQLQSFDNFSYIGNLLCGPPITKNCSRNGETPDVINGGSSEGRHRFEVNWLYVSMVVGFVMGFWGVVAPLIFIRSWRFAYNKILEHIGDKLYVFWVTIGIRI